MLADRILYIDAEAIVLDKPAGLPVDRPRDGSLSLENHLESLSFGFRRWPSPVHRLDRDTSGCLLLARGPRAQKRFGQSWERGEARKTYLAVIDGIPADRGGLVDMPLGKTSSREAGWRMVPDSRGRAARTRWTVIAEAGGRALVRFEPETGRTHQLRVHAASGIGLPIVGDPVYGQAGRHMLLHARRLVLSREGKPAIDATAPLPPPFHALGFDPAATDMDGTDAGG